SVCRSAADRHGVLTLTAPPFLRRPPLSAVLSLETAPRTAPRPFARTAEPACSSRLLVHPGRDVPCFSFSRSVSAEIVTQTPESLFCGARTGRKYPLRTKALPRHRRLSTRL